LSFLSRKLLTVRGALSPFRPPFAPLLFCCSWPSRQALWASGSSSAPVPLPCASGLGPLFTASSLPLLWVLVPAVGRSFSPAPAHVGRSVARLSRFREFCYGSPVQSCEIFKGSHLCFPPSTFLPWLGSSGEGGFSVPGGYLHSGFARFDSQVFWSCPCCVISDYLDLHLHSSKAVSFSPSRVERFTGLTFLACLNSRGVLSRFVDLLEWGWFLCRGSGQ
jgi:hypothetical protein